METAMDMARRTGARFPGRPACRPNFVIKPSSSTTRIQAEKDEQGEQCRKSVLPDGKAHSHGVYTAQCGCKHPKLLGYSVLRTPEIRSTAISVLLTHFCNLPRVVVYDNVCNVVRSVGLRARWVLKRVRFVIDRILVFGHKCGQFIDANEMPCVDRFGFSSTESINSSLALSRGTLSILSGDNYICFLTVRAVDLNVAAQPCEYTGKSDIEDERLGLHWRRIFPCRCLRCTEKLHFGSEIVCIADINHVLSSNSD
jgi:hypothetical protein